MRPTSVGAAPGDRTVRAIPSGRDPDPSPRSRESARLARVRGRRHPSIDLENPTRCGGALTMIRTTSQVFVLLSVGWFAAAAEIPRPEHPTPDAVREHWANLNGRWEFRFDPGDEGRQAGWFRPDAEGFDRTIVVPFGWESELSGVHEVKGAPKVGWYRRTFTVPDDFPKGDRVWLRFGAVDDRADVWVNGRHVAEHEGGYTPF